MPTETCPRCGQPHVTRTGRPSCTSHAKHTARPELATGPLTPCKAAPIRGLDVCGAHGGKTPRSRAAAGRTLEHAAAERAVRTLGLPVDTSPTEALLEEVRWTAGHVQWLRSKVQELADDPANHELVWGETKAVEKHSGQWPGTDRTETAAPSIWYQLYAKEREHLVTVCAAAIKAGVEERRVRLAEQQGDLVATVIRRILDALTLTPAQLELVPVVVPRELRAITGGAA